MIAIIAYVALPRFPPGGASGRCGCIREWEMFCHVNRSPRAGDIWAGRWRGVCDRGRALSIDGAVYTVPTAACAAILAHVSGAGIPHPAALLGALALYLVALALLRTSDRATLSSFPAQLKHNLSLVPVALIAPSVVRLTEGDVLLTTAMLAAMPAIVLLNTAIESRRVSAVATSGGQAPTVAPAPVPLQQPPAGDGPSPDTMDGRGAASIDSGLSPGPADAFAMISHDLVGPLAVLQVTSEILLRENLDPLEDRKLRAMIRSGAARLNRLVHDLLDVFALETGRLLVRREELALGPVCDEALAEAREVDRAEHVFRLRLGAPRRVSIDRPKFLSVVRNLLSNAAKYAPDGTAITLWVEIDAPTLRVSIEDEGPGIAAEHVPRIFEKSYRAVSGPTAPGGSGLGLYMARMLVELQGGSIWVDSLPGSGSRFTFTLPLSPAGNLSAAGNIDQPHPAAVECTHIAGALDVKL